MESMISTGRHLPTALGSVVSAFMSHIGKRKHFLAEAFGMGNKKKKFWLQVRLEV